MRELAVDRPGVAQRAVPLGFGGELLGLVLVERGAGRDLSAPEEEVLAELGRQMGLALHNTQLDLALQDTLDEVRRQAAETRRRRAGWSRPPTTSGAASTQKRIILGDQHPDHDRALFGGLPTGSDTMRRRWAAAASVVSAPVGGGARPARAARSS